MATEICSRDAARTPVLSIHKQSDGCALFGCVGTGQSHLYTRGSLHIEDVDAAFREELGLRIVPADAIVIERSALPEVVWTPLMKRWETVPDERGMWAGSGDDPETYRRRAEENLALAEHLAANPPVDEAKVEALTQILREDAAIRGHRAENAAEPIARRLLATGRIEVTP